MRFQNRLLVGVASVFAFAATTAATMGPAMPIWADNDRGESARVNDRENEYQVVAAANRIHLELTPSSQQLAQCLPDADVDVTVKLTTDKKGFDVFDSRLATLPRIVSTQSSCWNRPVRHSAPPSTSVTSGPTPRAMGMRSST